MTVIVAVIGAPVVFCASNTGTLPSPAASNPIKVFEFVQVNSPPAGVLVKDVIGTSSPLHTEISAGTIAEEGSEGTTLKATTTSLGTQEFEGVPVTVYDKLVPGVVKLTLGPIVVLSPVAGNHSHV